MGREIYYFVNILRDVLVNFVLFRSNFVKRKKLGYKGGCGSKWFFSKIVRFIIYCFFLNYLEFFWIYVWI